MEAITGIVVIPQEKRPCSAACGISLRCAILHGLQLLCGPREQLLDLFRTQKAHVLLLRLPPDGKICKGIAYAANELCGIALIPLENIPRIHLSRHIGQACVKAVGNDHVALFLECFQIIHD